VERLAHSETKEKKSKAQPSEKMMVVHLDLIREPLGMSGLNVEEVGEQSP
jgi:hypothetical protein